ncbi:MAG: DEAD/DEAH box helicase [Candidatus Omnitrophota bacterium]
MFDSLKLIKGERIRREELSRKLAELGYSRKQGIAEEGDFSVKGDVVMVYPATFEYPLRIEVSGDVVGRIVSVDISSFRSIYEHGAVILIPARRAYFRKRVWTERDPIDVFVDIEPGDYVVHVEHGIGMFAGRKTIRGRSGREECVAIEYKDGDVLYVPIHDLDKVQKYIYFYRKKPKLSKLGGKAWEKMKERAARGVLKVARDILEVQAKRESMRGVRFSGDTDWQADVEKMFPYKETPDQLRAARDVKSDMENHRPMDRLLCGDVGYGKTEVAFRAAFKAVMDNKQVAILVPTTILAEQHFNTFSSRVKQFPVTIEMLSRFRKKTDQDDVIKKLAKGQVDIVIGTHRLLSDDIAFKDLGLVIIDEEQRFGVRHKEKLKHMRLMVDVLTLTATPIPRTLYLALMGGRGYLRDKHAAA